MAKARSGTHRLRIVSRGEPAAPDNGPLSRQLLAEGVGTFFLTLVAAGADVISALSAGEVGPVARAVAPGLLVMAMIYSLGHISGAHLNPVVTAAFTLRGVFDWRRLPVYWSAQLIGALAAAGALLGLFGPAADVGATRPRFGLVPALATEVVLTLLLVSVILATATRHSVIGPNAAFAVGGTIALCGLVAMPVSGASMNPARSLGPAVLAGQWGELWVYVAGPLLGALLAVGLAFLLHGAQRAGEAKAAAGERGHGDTGSRHGRHP